MTTASTKALLAKDEQKKMAKRATFEALRSKKRVEKEFEVVLTPGEDPISFLFRSIGSADYDRLLMKHPPTQAQIADGATYNQETFAPALLSMVCAEPVMDTQEWSELWTSPEWNRGEIGQLFWTAVELCNKGLDLSPIEAD